MKNNETSFRHSRSPRTALPGNPKKGVAGQQFRHSPEPSVGAQRRKLEAKQRRRERKERGRAGKEKERSTAQGSDCAEANEDSPLDPVADGGSPAM